MERSLQGTGKGKAPSGQLMQTLEGRVDVLCSEGRIQPPEWMFPTLGWSKCALSCLSPSVQEGLVAEWGGWALLHLGTLPGILGLAQPQRTLTGTPMRPTGPVPLFIILTHHPMLTEHGLEGMPSPAGAWSTGAEPLAPQPREKAKRQL